jgi:hypothetical protein
VGKVRSDQGSWPVGNQGARRGMCRNWHTGWPWNLEGTGGAISQRKTTHPSRSVPSRYSPACPSALDEESEMVCFQDPCPKTQASLPARCNPPLVHRTSNAGGSPPMIRTSTSGHHLPHAIRSRPPSPWPPLHCTHCTHRTHQLDTTERISGPRLIDDPRLAGTAGRASPLMAPRHLRHALI